MNLSAPRLSALGFAVLLSSAQAVTTSQAVPVPPGQSQYPYPMTLTDDTGQTVRLLRKPQRIVSMMPSHTETLAAIGAGAQVVGVDTYSNYPPSLVSKWPKVGSGYQPNVEAIVALKPDLVLTDEGKSGLAQKLRAAGLTVYSGTAQTYNETFEKIATLGKMTGHSTRALQLITQMRAELGRLQASVVAAPKLSVYYEVDPTPYAAGPNSFIGTLITKAGGRNVIPAPLGPFPKISPELVVSAAPQVMVGLRSEEARQRPGWNTIPAVKTGRVYRPSSEENDVLVRPGPRLPQALRLLITMLHPEVLK